MVMQVTEITDQSIWDSFVSASPFGHPLQLWGWGEVKRQNGWQPLRLGVQLGDHLECAAQVLLWNIPKTKFKLAYVPRGPVIDPVSSDVAGLLEAVAREVKGRGAIQLKVEPAWQGMQLPAGWKQAKDGVLLAETYAVNLKQEAVTMMAAVDAKARYYVRKAERDGVTIRRVMDRAGFLQVMTVYKDTAARAKFGLHHDDYYRALLEKGGEHNYLLLAEKAGKPLAFVWILAAGSTAFELYGGMTREGGKLHATYALKAHAMEQMQAEGFAWYDFNGRLNEGITKFKSVWGAEELDWIGSWNLPLRQPQYAIWQMAWPLGKKISKLIK